MFDTSCPSRDDPLKEYSILFPNKLNTQEFLYCAMEKYDLSICPGIRKAGHQSFSASTQPSQTRHDRLKITDFMGEKQTPLNPPDCATTISLNPPDRPTTISRLITVE